MNNNNFEKINFLKIKKENGQKFLDLFINTYKNENIIEKKVRIIKEDDYVLIPLIERRDLNEFLTKIIHNQFEYQIISKESNIHLKIKYRALQDVLKDKIFNKYKELIPKSFDIIGEIAIIEFNTFKFQDDENLHLIKKEIAEAITLVNNKIISVYEKISEIKGIFRLRKLNLLYGKDISETIYRENSCLFKLDIKRTFFTPRLVYERNRIVSSNIKENEIIIDMFAGVGPFSIQIAKKHKVMIHAFDINPYAYNYLCENISLNKLIGTITPHNLDINNLLNSNNEIGKSLKNKADRVIMNFPENSIKYLNVACYLMKKSGGILHNYQISTKPNSIKNAINKLDDNLRKNNWFIGQIITSKVVKPFSPKSDLVVIDLIIRK
jgi:tRNA (guanine37-N1)-methyltransferase